MWRTTRITADAAKNLQINAGLLLRAFDIHHPAAPTDEQIICETTGEFTITCTPVVEDLIGDMNCAPIGTKEGRVITGWKCGLNVTALSITPQTLALALGAGEAEGDNGVRGRAAYRPDDFRCLDWIGDMMDENRLFVVVMEDTVSTGGITFTSRHHGKGALVLNLTAHGSVADPQKVPMAFYLLEKEAQR